MLIRLKSSEKNIASSTLVLFVTGWLMLLCQTCLAAGEGNDQANYSDSLMAAHCHSTDNETEKLDEHYAGDNNHCLGFCDCNEVPTTLNSSDAVKHPDTYKYISLIYTKSVFLDVPEYRIFKTTYPISIYPEQSIHLSLQNFTILLI